jgi:hypothetical protein
LQIFEDTLVGGVTKRFFAEKPEHLMQVPFEILDCVAFLCYRDSPDVYKYAGTCFYFGFEDPKTKILFSYLVSAKHVIIAAKSHSMDGKIYIRVNIKDSRAEYFEVPSEWVSLENSDGPTIDVSVVRWLHSQNHELKLLHHDLAATVDTINREFISVGDEVFYVGLFPDHPGDDRNIPIVKFGNIASFPVSGIPTNHFGRITAFLMESRSIGGLSGSPVFVHINSGQRRQFGSNRIYNSEDKIFLIGLLHGHWNLHVPRENAPIVEKQSDSVMEEEKLNMGISIVIPVWDIIKTIESHP